jgi:hypothetical protein
MGQTVALPAPQVTKRRWAWKEFVLGAVAMFVVLAVIGLATGAGDQETAPSYIPPISAPITGGSTDPASAIDEFVDSYLAQNPSLLSTFCAELARVGYATAAAGWATGYPGTQGRAVFDEMVSRC